MKTSSATDRADLSVFGLTILGVIVVAYLATVM
jgi:hypothetical protein